MLVFHYDHRETTNLRNCALLRPAGLNVRTRPFAPLLLAQISLLHYQPPAPASHQHLLLIPAGLLHSRSASEGIVALSLHSTDVFNYWAGREDRERIFPEMFNNRSNRHKLQHKKIQPSARKKFFHHKVGQRLDQITQASGSSILGDT